VKESTLPGSAVRARALASENPAAFQSTLMVSVGGGATIGGIVGESVGEPVKGGVGAVVGANVGGGAVGAAVAPTI